MVIAALREGRHSVLVLCGFPLCVLPGDFLSTVLLFCYGVYFWWWGNRISGIHFFQRLKNPSHPGSVWGVSAVLMSAAKSSFQIIWVHEALLQGIFLIPECCCRGGILTFVSLLRAADKINLAKEAHSPQERERVLFSCGRPACWPEATHPCTASELAQGNRAEYKIVCFK